MQCPCQDITPRMLTRQTKTDDVKLKHMTSLIGLALCYFVCDVKLTAAARGFLKSRFFLIHSLNDILRQFLYVYTQY